MKSFIVKDIFAHRVPGYLPIWLDGYFDLKIYNQSRNMVINIPEKLPILNEYELPCYMADWQLLRKIQSKPMTLEEYYLIVYLLLVEPSLVRASKTVEYIFFVEFNRETSFFNLKWVKNYWCLKDCGLRSGGGFSVGSKLISLP